MLHPSEHARSLRAAGTCRRIGLTQAEIAMALGASQGQVSRILAGRIKRASRLFEEVCLYVERTDKGVTVDAVQANADLMGALRETWDGSAAHAKALATIIRSTRALGPVAGKKQC